MTNPSTLIRSLKWFKLDITGYSAEEGLNVTDYPLPIIYEADREKANKALQAQSKAKVEGESNKYVQVQLGHATPMTTLNVYSHLIKEENQEAKCRLENAIFNTTGHNLVTKQKQGLTING